MQHTDFQWLTPDGVNIQAVHWQPEGTPAAVVCIAHGLGEHAGRYRHVAAYFAKHLMATFAYDRRGHGKSGGVRGHTPSFEAYLEEIHELLNVARREHPGLPIFLYGHSMGGNLVLNFALKKKFALAGVISTGPWILLPKPPSAALVFFAKIMRGIVPSLAQPNGLNPNDLSKDPAVVKAYLEDPLVHDRISVNAGYEMLQAAARLNAFSGKMPCPVLLMHGLEDRLTSPQGSEAFSKRAGGDVTWKGWTGLKHEIHNEPEQHEVLQFMVEWMAKRCGQVSSFAPGLKFSKQKI